MNVIASFHDAHAADALKKRLEQAGIAVHVQASRSLRGGVMTKHLVFAALESQYQDALALAADPNHRVQNRIDLNDYHRHLSNYTQHLQANETILRGLFIMLAVLLVVVAILGWLMLR